MRWHRPAAVLLFLLALLAACEEGSILPVAMENILPHTEITGELSPGDVVDPWVHLRWKGHDHDGEIVAYEWRLSDNGPDGMVSVADTLDLAWHRTTGTDTLLLVSVDLDSFPPDLTKWATTATAPRFWQTHSFFVRSIDDDGDHDLHPAVLSFTAVTEAPQAQFLSPTVPAEFEDSCMPTNSEALFTVYGYDPDGAADAILMKRHLLLKVGGPEDPCLTREEYEATHPLDAIAPDDPRWSDWTPYDDLDADSWRIEFSCLEAPASYLLALQMRDEAGAVTPTLEWGTNVRHLLVPTPASPPLAVDEPTLGIKYFFGTSGVVRFEVLEGEEYTFSWWSSPLPTLPDVEAYRHGWNVIDPTDDGDDGWITGWASPEDPRVFDTGPLEVGLQRLVVQVRNVCGTLGQGIVELSVSPAP